ncbi:hypothetical protein WN51_12057 [Melipona quadrifasciata]|uniref:Uncharacterized protein n=1 Tax=Melipona quadrifasciata TaxID=166423 RepID=A0A0M9A247_9HYME|nr:hypothetical protein WN51_12057 [Melipona quadrifasciata]
MPYILVRGNLASYGHRYPWRVLVSGLKASDIEQLSRFASGGYCDDSTIVYLQHPCVILTALEVLGYKVVASSSTSVKQDYNDVLKQNNIQISKRNQNSAIETRDENFASLNKGTSRETNQNNTPATSAIPEECHENQSSNIEKESSNQKQSSDSYLQNKTTGEDLFHKRAARKFAELEVQRKELELERLKWEFEKEKHQNEILWNHEVHMMYYKEQKAKHNLKET